LAINGLVFFVLLNIIYWSLPVLQLALGQSGSSATTLYSNPGKHLPNYASIDWAEQHIRELDQAQMTPARTDFKSFIGWRRKPFNGETINIGGPYAQRRTVNTATSDARKAYFFGGSTMWGTGANDEGTIPSQFAALTGMNTDNFGEAGYTAHHSLMLLIQLLQDGHRPDLVVFYDGVNEVAIKCVTELTPDSHMLEARIDSLLKEQATSPASFAHYLAPVWYVAGRVKSVLTRNSGVARAEGFNCHVSPEKASRIADNVLQDWQMAKRIVESYGIKFVGILQPAIYFSRTRRDHLADVFPLMQTQFLSVYPLIKQRIAEAGNFHDLTSVLDFDEYFYIDFCHLSPNGNRRVAARIAEIANSLGFGQ
jgi:lysophospholipase L1-like esterase